MFPLLFAIAALTGDTTRYVVLNHGRPAGEMRIARIGDTVAVHYHHVDRNRGPHVESRYRLSPTGDVLFAETRALPLFQETVANAPADRVELQGDSVRRSGRGGTQARAREAGVYYGSVNTPFDQTLVEQFLLRQPNHRAKLPNEIQVIG